MPQFPSMEWVQALRDQAQQSEDFLATCKKYPDDDVILVCEEDREYPETRCYYLRVSAGGISGVEEIETPLDRDASFVVLAPFSTWRRTIQLPAIQIASVLRGDFTIEGNREELLRRVRESAHLFNLIRLVPTTFPSATL